VRCKKSCRISKYKAWCWWNLIPFGNHYVSWRYGLKTIDKGTKPKMRRK
jgi:hypothetical protein